MSMKIGELYSELGFRVDWKKLRQYESRLRQVNKNLNTAGQRFQKQLQANTKTQVASLTAVEKRIDSQRGKLYQLRQDYWRTNSEFKRGNISHERRERILNDINRQYQAQKRHIRDINREHSRSRVGRMQATGRALNRPIRASGGVAQGAAAGAVAGGAGAAMVGAAAGTAGLYMSNEMHQRQQSIIRGLEAIEGSIEAGRNRWKELVSTSDQMGLFVLDVADQFKQIRAAMQGTGLEDLAVDLTTAIGAFSQTSGMTGTERTLVIDALSDLAAEGNLTTMNQGQLSRASGINPIELAKALGMSIEQFNSALTEGKITTEVFVPAFTDYLMSRANQGGALDRQAQSTQAQQNRLMNQLLDSNTVLNIAGLNEHFNKLYQGFAEMLDKSEAFIQQVGEFFGSIAESTRQELSAIGELVGAFGRLSDTISGEDIDKAEEGISSFAQLLLDFAAWVDRLSVGIERFREIDAEFTQDMYDFGQSIADTFNGAMENLSNGIIDTLNNIPGFNLSRVDYTPDNGHDAIKGAVEAINQNLRHIKPPSQAYTSNMEPLYVPPASSTNSSNNTTVNQNNNLTVNIDGAQQPDQILGTIEDHINGMLRSAAMNDSSGEK